MELNEMINGLLGECIEINPNFFGGEAIKLINLSANEYGHMVLAYVDNVLNQNLLAENGYVISANQDYTLYNKVVENAEYRDQIVKMIAAYTIIENFIHYKPMADSTTKLTVYTRGYAQFLEGNQIRNLAKYFDSKINLENSKKQTR